MKIVKKTRKPFDLKLSHLKSLLKSVEPRPHHTMCGCYVKRERKRESSPKQHSLTNFFTPGFGPTNQPTLFLSVFFLSIPFPIALIDLLKWSDSLAELN